MIGLVIASAIHAAMLQSTAANSARSALRACIKEAAAQATTQKLAADAFTSFIRQQCAAQESSFKSAVWAFDSKNKVSRKQSEADVKVQVEDFVTMAAERFAAENAPQ